MKNFNSELHTIPTFGPAIALQRDGRTDGRTAASRLNIVTCSQLTEKLQRRVSGPPADSAYSHVGKFVLKTKKI
jgi:hypothetical protein